MKKIFINLYSISDRAIILRLAALLVLVTTTTLLEMFGISLFFPLLQIIIDPDGLNKTPFIGPYLTEYYDHYGETLLPIFSAGLLAFFYVKNIILAILGYLQAKIIFNAQALMQGRVMEAYAYRDYLYQISRNSSHLTRTAMLSTPTVFAGVLQPTVSILLEVLLIGAGTALMISIDPVAALSSFAFVASCLSIYYLIVAKPLSAWGRDIETTSQRMFQRISELTGAICELRLMGREQHAIGHFLSDAKHRGDVQTHRAAIEQLPRLVGEAVMLTGIMLLVVVLLINGDKSVKELLPILGLFAATAFRIMPSVNRLVHYATQIRSNAGALESLVSSLAELEDVEKKESSPTIKVDNGNNITFTHVIKFSDVMFTYPGSANSVLSGINFSISRGEHIGLVGASGAGKSTSANILMGLIQPDSGAILVDGVDILSNLSSWQRLIGFVPQQIYLCDDTIRRNIALGLPDEQISDAAIMRALSLAHLEPLISDLPNGLDTLVGEFGTRLSGGQRQRLGIARALYHDPEILVLDEATSSLDNDTQQSIAEAIGSLSREKTIIAIAHRTETIQACDRLVFFEAGQVQAIGTFDELIKASEDFRRVVNHK